MVNPSELTMYRLWVSLMLLKEYERVSRRLLTPGLTHGCRFEGRKLIGTDHQTDTVVNVVGLSFQTRPLCSHPYSTSAFGERRHAPAFMTRDMRNVMSGNCG